MSENKNAAEMHGCIVCARIFNILAVYTPDGRLVDRVLASPGGLTACRRINDDHRSPAIPTQQGKLKLLIKDGSPGKGEELDNEQKDE